MSIISNARFKIAENAAELLALLQGLGVDTSAVENVSPKAKEQAENVKRLRKLWKQQHPEKCKMYLQKYYASDKGQAALKRYAEKERTPEVRAKRQAYRERPENRERQRAYAAEYYERNKERLNARARERYERNKEQINANRRERYAERKSNGID